MPFEPWDPQGDRFGLFAWDRQLYLIPIHPILSVLDSHRAGRVVWRPEPRAVPAFIPREEKLGPVAGPFRTREKALERAAHPEMRHRYGQPADEEPA